MEILTLFLLFSQVKSDTLLIYPNPFGNVEYNGIKYSQAKIEFYLDESADVEITIYDMFGHPVKTIRKNSLPAGESSVYWDGRNNSGKKVSSGTYLVIFKAFQGARVLYVKKKMVSVVW